MRPASYGYSYKPRGVAACFQLAHDFLSLATDSMPRTPSIKYHRRCATIDSPRIARSQIELRFRVPAPGLL